MFHPKIYKLFNNDLKNLNNNQLFIHWKTIGIKENRISHINHFLSKYPNFNLDLYRENYPDIKNLDNLIIMSHYHHNKYKNYYSKSNHIQKPKIIKNNIVENVKNNKEDNDYNNKIYINEYIDKYYNFQYTIAFIVFNNFINLEKLKDLKYNVYVFYDNEKYSNEIKKFVNTNIKFINIYNYNLNDYFINLKYDYFLFPINFNAVYDNILLKNPNILSNDDFTIIKKKYLKNINCYDLINFKIDPNYFNIILSNNNIDYINYKFYKLLNIINNEIIDLNNKTIHINIDVKDDNLIWIIQLICYIEKLNYNITINKNNFIFLKNYFSTINEIDYTTINNFKNINNLDKIIINNKIEFLPIDFDNIYKINTDMMNNIFKNLLFLDLKKEIIFIYLDTNIDENFIINSLINLDFQNSIIIIYNFNKNYKVKNFLNSLSFINFEEILVDENHKNYLLLFGFFANYYIGNNNNISKFWNYINNNIIFYINHYDVSYFYKNNIIFNNNKYKSEYFNGNIISYNYKLFYVLNENLINLDNKYNFIIDFYFNDYIFKLYFNKNYFKLKEIEFNNKNINLINHNNDYYLKYFNKVKNINEQYIIDIFGKYSIKNYTKSNTSSIINKIIIVIQLYEIENIDYYENIIYKIFNKYQYIIEFFYKKYSNLENIIKYTESINKNSKFNIVNDNNYYNIFQTLKKKYTCYDIIYVIKNYNLNIFDISKDITCFIYNNNNYLERNNYICFNLKKLIDNDLYFLSFFKINRLLSENNEIINNIEYYINQSYINNIPVENKSFSKNILTKFLIYSENDYRFFDKINDIFFIYKTNCIKYFKYYLYNENLEIINENNEITIINIDIINLNLFLNKIQHKIFIFFVFTKIEFDINYEKLENTIIYNDYNNLHIIIIDSYLLKDYGFFSNYYFKDKSTTELNIFLLTKKFSFNIYNYTENKLYNYEIINSHNIIKYFNNIDLNHILNIRKINNLYNLNYLYSDYLDITIINLKNRLDKKLFMINQMNKLCINNYNFFEGIVPNKDDLTKYNFIKSEYFLNKLNINYVLGSAGCKLSHYNLLKSIKKNNKYTLILEDDAVLEYNFLSYIFYALNNLIKNNFDLLYLSCNLNNNSNSKIIKPNILKVDYPKTTTAYIVKNSNLNNIINTIENSNNEIDDSYASSNLCKLCIFPMICYQKDINSDIISNNNYGYYHDKYYF